MLNFRLRLSFFSSLTCVNSCVLYDSPLSNLNRFNIFLNSLLLSSVAVRYAFNVCFSYLTVGIIV